MCIIVGDVAGANNVAFTEAYRKSRQAGMAIWIVGRDDEVSRRVASRVLPSLSDLAQALREAQSSGLRVEILANPQEILKTGGKGGCACLAGSRVVRGRQCGWIRRKSYCLGK